MPPYYLFTTIAKVFCQLRKIQNTLLSTGRFKTEPPADKEGMSVHPLDSVGGLGGVGSKFTESPDLYHTSDGAWGAIISYKMGSTE
jgi:hypothetical protein